MMKIHELPGDPGKRQKRKRVGRGSGSGHGQSSGRGTKGHSARAGGGKGAGFEGGQLPMHRRVPKRGFNNPFRSEFAVVNLAQLNVFDDGTDVTVGLLYDRRLARPRGAPVKILGHGDLSRKLKITADAFSRTAREKIAAAGGAAEVAQNAG